MGLTPHARFLLCNSLAIRPRVADFNRFVQVRQLEDFPHLGMDIEDIDLHAFLQNRSDQAQGSAGHDFERLKIERELGASMLGVFPATNVEGFTTFIAAGYNYQPEPDPRLQKQCAETMALNQIRMYGATHVLAVGLVSLPGMMTGQIIAGADPQIAARYQIMVMAMVMSSAGFAVALFLLRRTQREAASV